MPHYSAFTRYGHLRFSSQPSRGELIYKALYNALGENYSKTIGSRAEARVYATAMLLARAFYMKTKAANQWDPRRVLELLPIREEEYGVIPGLTDSVFDRQDALIAKQLLPRGAMYTAVTEALTNAIGSDFLYYRVTKRAEIVTDPPSAGASPGNWIEPGKDIKAIRLVGAVSILGSPQPVQYETLDPDEVPRITAGDKIVVSANNIGLAELVTVSIASTSPPVFIATFTKAHDPGDICTTAPFPYWISNQQVVLVIVTPEAAFNSEKRRKVDQVMKQIMRTWVQWVIVPDDGTGTGTATYTIEDPTLGRVGYAGIGTVTYP